MFSDYLLTKGNVFIGHLYNGSSSNKHYYYHRGWNIQALFAYVCGIALPFPGFVGTLVPNPANWPRAATDIGRLGWLLSFFVSFVIYYGLCCIWPTRNQRLIKEMGNSWEEASGDLIVGEDGTQIIEEGGEVKVVGDGLDVEYVAQGPMGLKGLN